MYNVLAPSMVYSGQENPFETFRELGTFYIQQHDSYFQIDDETNPRYCDSNKDGDDGDHDPGHVDVVVADNPGRAQEDVVVEDDEDRDREDAGGEERVEDLGDDAELDVANLVGDVVLDPANLRNIVL